MMKTEIENYAEKILSQNSEISTKAIKQIAQMGDYKQLSSLFSLLLKKHVGNGVTIAVKAIGNAQNQGGKDFLIACYEQANENEKKLIIESLLKLGVFKKHFFGKHYPVNIQEKLWALFSGLNSSKLKAMLSLETKEFHEKLDFAWKITKHWRN
jgi:hypothetical protein